MKFACLSLLVVSASAFAPTSLNSRAATQLYGEYGASSTSFYTTNEKQDSYASLDDILQEKCKDEKVKQVIVDMLDVCADITEALRTALVTVEDTSNEFGDTQLSVDVSTIVPTRGFVTRRIALVKARELPILFHFSNVHFCQCLFCDYSCRSITIRNAICPYFLQSVDELICYRYRWLPMLLFGKPSRSPVLSARVPPRKTLSSVTSMRVAKVNSPSAGILWMDPPLLTTTGPSVP